MHFHLCRGPQEHRLAPLFDPAADVNRMREHPNRTEVKVFNPQPESHSPGESSKKIESMAPRLLARIHRRYQTLTETLEFPNLALRFTRIADPNRVLDEV